MLTVKRASPIGFMVLAIVVVELFVFIPSTTEEFVVESFVAPSPQASLSIKGFRAVHLNQKGQKETIEAKEAELFKRYGYAILKDVQVRIYSKEDHTFYIIGATGKYYMEKKDIELFNDIVVLSESMGYELKTNYLRYEEAKSLLWSDQTFQLAGPNPSEPSLVVTGKGMRANTNTEELDVLSEVHCRKYDVGTEGIEIDSDHAKVFLDKDEALFRDNVLVKQKDMNIFSDNFLVSFNRENQSIDKAKAYDIVKIVQKDRVATCQTAFLLNREKKIVMRGMPEVRQGNDVIKGNIIIFFTSENKILFDEAIGEVEVKRAGELN